MQDILGLEPLEAGVRFLPITLVSFFAAAAGGQLLNRIPARAFFGVGLTLVGVGLLLMGGVSAGDEWTTLLAGFLVAGAGIGMTNPAIASIAVGVVPATKAGMGSGINNTFRQVGIATGIAALGAIFQHDVESRLAGAGAPHELGETIASTGTRVVAEQAPQFTGASEDAFIGALNELFVIAGIVALVGAALGLLLTRDSDLVPHGGPPG
jgi:MFS family permease